ncbi:glycosyltransferase family 2 protein [Synergistes jonesii]|uniref:Glycosyltransferase 2-like domain-containing protein n=1 Tax=Synergistes jonesii TaxID=2754 RepID=A0A073IP73_9BACT|nr:glycosyltransferase [Synergistes jonesii]KEJ92163.1 hypothetical protein EH55_05350 [Synergistes jonesii]
MSDRPLLSIILIAYNHEKYIRRALESIIMQRTDFPFEVLVAEDCSTDSTPSILKEYAARRPDIFNLILHSQNVGVVRNSRDARKRCRGKYIAVLEGDDYWTDPLKLQKQFDFMESHPDFSACAHEISFIDDDGNEREGFAFDHFTKEQVCTIADVEKGLHAGQSSTLMYKNVFLSFTEQQDEDYCACECIPDLKLMLLLTLYGPVFRINEAMSAYRYVTTSDSASWSAYSHNNNLSLSYFKWADECVKMADKVFGRKIEFRKYRIDVGYHAWVELLKNPTRENAEIFAEVFGKSKNKTAVIARIITGTLSYPIRKIKKAIRRNYKIL